MSTAHQVLDVNWNLNCPSGCLIHIQNWLWYSFNPFSESIPLPQFCNRRPLQNYPVQKKNNKKNVWKTCSPIILLHLPLFTSLQQFPLCVRTKPSRYPLIALLPKESDWSRNACFGKKRFTRQHFKIHLREFTVAIIIIYVNPTCPA